MKLIAALATISLVGCLQGQESFDVSSTESVTFPGLPVAAAQIAPGALSTDSHLLLDVHDNLAALSHQGALSAAFSQHTLTGDGLSQVSHVRATIESADGTMPVVLLSDADVPAASSEVQLPLSIPGDQLLEYLGEGKVDIHFFLNGSLSPDSLKLTHTLTGHVTIAVNGSVTKL
jgi:hypothetical protein